MASRNSRSPIERAPLPASLEVMVERTAAFIRDIEGLRAACFLQQLANAHRDDDTFVTLDSGEEQTYGQRMAQLEEFERRVRDGLPKSVLERLPAE